MSSNPDLLLFEEVKKGNEKAFKEIFHKYYNDLARFCFSMVRDTTIAEELTQEIFIYIWEKKDKIDISTSFKSYLYSAIKNKSINYIKYELPKQRALVDLSDTLLSPNTPLHDKGETKRLKKKINLAIDQLPEKCKQIFLLSRFGGLIYTEIAEELNISAKTVENQMSIALKKLRESLAADLKNYLNE